jgi:hypothetical protein
MSYLLALIIQGVGLNRFLDKRVLAYSEIRRVDCGLPEGAAKGYW